MATFIAAHMMESRPTLSPAPPRQFPEAFGRASSRFASRGWLILLAFLMAGGLLAVIEVRVRAGEATSEVSVPRELRSFREMGRVLYIAAHPDDENTQLITYLARGRFYRTAYLSLTRGDGGQNVLGPELGAELGVIRTQELLAARRIDGGQQFFTRAIDFGFSKDYRETLNIWDRQEVLSDIVRVIRMFQPDVLITRFSPEPSGTHGHHTASAVLALEAFKLAGNPDAFPEQLSEQKLKPWQSKRIFQNGGGFGRGGGAAKPSSTVVRMEVGGNDPVSGESFGDLAALSRSMHKTQGFGNFGGFGRGGGGPRTESFELLAGEPASQDVMDGVDTTWARMPGGAEIGPMADKVIADFDPQNPSASVPLLLSIRTRLLALAPDAVTGEKRRQLDGIVKACLGLAVETSISQAEVVPGESLTLRHTVTVNSSVPVRWLAVRYPALKREEGPPMDLHAHQPATRELTAMLPATTPLTQPYWLRKEPTAGMFRVDDPSLIGRPENPPVFPIEYVFEVNGQEFVVSDEPAQITADLVKGERARRLDVIAPVSLTFPSQVRLFAPGATQPLEIQALAARAGVAGTLQLDAPPGWKVTPEKQAFHLMTSGDRVRFTFKVTAPTESVADGIGAHAEIGGARFESSRVDLRYGHIPPQLLQPTVRMRALSLPLSIRGKKIGYLAGAGDGVAESLQEMGYAVTQLSGADLTTNRLSGFDAVVVGVRAFNVRTDLVTQLPALYAYVEAGGNLVVQYNRPGRDLKLNGKLGPYSLRVSNERVTDEHAAVTFLAPEHPVLNTPNKINQADFEGWVQERGTYFPDQWDAHFTPIVECGDANETPLKGGLLVAPYGKGYFVYTGLTFFRQLPNGVPGAYRLFANLVSLGK